MKNSSLRVALRALLLGMALPAFLGIFVQVLRWPLPTVPDRAHVDPVLAIPNPPAEARPNVERATPPTLPNPVQISGIDLQAPARARAKVVPTAPPLPRLEFAEDPSASMPPTHITGFGMRPPPAVDLPPPPQEAPPRRPAIELRPELESDPVPNRQEEPPARMAGPSTIESVRQDRDTARLEARLASLQQQLDRLTQVQFERQSSELQRVTQMMQQLHQTSQLQNLEREIEQLRRQQAEAEPPAEVSSVPVLPLPSTPPAPERPPVITAQPAEGGSERFSLQIQDADILQVLEMLGQLAGLNIVPGRGVTGKVSANLQQVTIEQALTAVLRSHGYVFERDGDFIYVMTPADAAARKQMDRKLITKIYHPHYVSVNDLAKLITPILTQSVGKISVTDPPESGIAQSRDEAGGFKLAQHECLLVQDYPEVIAEIDRIVESMDVPPLQVVIEAKFLSVRLTDQMRYGVNFALLSGSGKDLFVFGDGSAIGVGSGFPPTGTDPAIPALTQLAASTAGLKYGFIHGDAAGFIQALESITDTNLIAAPQVSVLNKQRAELIIGDRLSYKTLAFNGTQTVENVNFLDAGTKLIIRPFISPDGLIRMEVHPERSSAVINEETGLPNQATTEVTTNVTVREGTTVVIGGLIAEEVTESVDRVPFLGSLPVLGAAFRNKVQRADRTELIVLLTPRLVREPEVIAQAEDLQKLNEQRANFFRDSLSPFNRLSLTRGYYDRALHYYYEGNLMKARRMCNEALRHNRNDLECLRLYNVIDQAIAERYGHWMPWLTAEPPQEIPHELPLAPPADMLPPLPAQPL